MKRINGKMTREYRAWKAMKSRCYSPSTKSGNYKKNNIKVCEEWKNSFENFLKDMGKCPNGYSLDRIDNLKDYSLDNCRWTNMKTQSSNRGSFNKIFTYNNKSKTLKQWSIDLEINYMTLYTRIYRSGLSFEEAIQNDPYNKLIEYKNKKQTLKEWCDELQLPLQTICDRKFQGWSIEDCFEKPIKKVKI
jgi:hypothetical protein